MLSSAKIWHEVAGAGPPVMMLHAGICDSGMWDPQWRRFPAAYRTVRCDLRGFGRTPVPARSYCHGADAVELIESLGLQGVRSGWGLDGPSAGPARF